MSHLNRGIPATTDARTMAHQVFLGTGTVGIGTIAGAGLAPVRVDAFYAISGKG
jgi:hypothetical protein